MTVVAKRIDVVWLDVFTKDTGLTQGNMVGGRYVPDYNSPKGSRYTWELFSDPQRPGSPRGTYPLAYVTIEKSTSDDGATFSHSVSDVTNTSRPAENFDSSSDFQVSHAGSLLFDVTGGTHGDGLFTQASSTSAVRNTLSWSVPTGQYDVRLRRETSDSSSDRIRDEVQWTAFRSIKDTEPVDATFASNYNIAQTQVVIKATDQLNGIVDQFNGVPSSILPDYEPDNDAWVERVTSNCASIARDIWQGNASKKPVPDSQLDIATLETLWQRCHDRLMQFNGVIQGGSAEDALKQVLSNARASRTLVDGIRTVIIDQEKTDVVQHFTPRNSRNFRGSKRFAKQPHALKVRLQNRLKGYQPDEVIVYDDGYSADGTNCEFNASDGSCSVATEFETLDTKGIVLGEQAYQYGRYQLATNKLRPENYELDVDIEHLVATPGDLIAVTHDVPIFGLASGRVKSLQTSGSDTTGVTLDETLELAANTDYTIRFRLSNGDSVTRDIQQVGSDTETQTVTFKTAIATASGPQVGDLAQFGLLDQETVFCIVKGITGGDPDWGATLTLVDHAQPGIDDSADSSIPAFDSNITDNPFTRQIPAAPDIEEVRSDESALVSHKDGSLEETIMVSYKLPSSDKFQTESAQFRFKKSGESSSYIYDRGETQSGTIHLSPVDVGDDYDVEARTLTQNGIAGKWTAVASSHTIIGKTTKPDPPQNLFISQGKGQFVRVTWEGGDEIDFSEFEFQRSRDTGVSWEPVYRGDSTTFTDDSFNWNESVTYRGRSIDRSGNKSGWVGIIGRFDLNTQADEDLLTQSGDTLIGGGPGAGGITVEVNQEELVLGKTSAQRGTITFGESGSQMVVERATIADDNASTVDLPNDNSDMILLSIEPESGTSAIAFISLKPDGGATSPVIAVQSDTNIEVTTGDLSGTTGTDGKFTVSNPTTSAQIAYENRLGSSTKVRISSLTDVA